MFHKTDGKFELFSNPPKNDVLEKLPAGRYMYQSPSPFQPPAFHVVIPQTDELVPLKGDFYNKINRYIDTFSTKRDLYDDLDIMWKLSFLFYGAPGTGKTAFIYQLTQQLIKKYDALVIEANIHAYKEMISIARMTDPNRLIVIVQEEVDDIIGDSREGTLLDFLDGASSENGIILFATTNYIGDVPERFTSRPSRFTVVEEIPLPSEDVRIQILKNRLPKKCHHLINGELIAKTDNMSIDHIKAVCIYNAIYEHSIDESIEIIRKMQKLAKED